MYLRLVSLGMFGDLLGIWIVYSILYYRDFVVIENIRKS